MGDGNQWIDEISSEELAKWCAGPGPSPLREVWTPPDPTRPPGLIDAASSIRIGPSPIYHEQLPGMTISPTAPELQSIGQAPQLPSGSNSNNTNNVDGPSHALDSTLSMSTFLGTARESRGLEQIARNTDLVLPHSSHTPSSDTSTPGISISVKCDKRQPTDDRVIFLRIENHVYLNIDLPFQLPLTWNAIQVPQTMSVKRVDAPSGGERILTLDIIVRGATTRLECDSVCDQCEERVGQKVDRPSLIDFHSPSNIIKQKNRTIHVHFTFCCYSRHHQEKDRQYILEVILKDASNPSEPRVVARKELPYYFDVTSNPPRVKKRTRDQTANNGPSPKIRRKASYPDLVTAPTAQLEVAPLPEDIEPQTPREQIAGETPDRNYSRQRTIRHVPPISEHEQQSPNSVQCPPPAISHPPLTSPAPHLRDVHPRRGSAWGGNKIWLAGEHFPAGSPLFARFGSSVAKTSWISPCLLSCYLPSSSHSGEVEVTLSYSPEPAAPLAGTSVAAFKYTTDSNPFLRLVSRILGLHHNINGAEHETAMIKVLGSLHESHNLHNLVSLPNEYGQTLAHWSVLSGQTRLLEKLVRWGVNLDIADVNGFTALHCAYLKKDYRTVRVLEGNGASQSVKDKVGRVPAKLAPDDLSEAIVPLAQELDLEPEEECPELVATLESDTDDEEADDIDVSHKIIEDGQDSVAIHSVDSSPNLGNTNLRYHEQAESEVKVVTDSESPIDAKSDEVRKATVERPDQGAENPCVCTCSQPQETPRQTPTLAHLDSRADTSSASDHVAQSLSIDVDRNISKEQTCEQAFATIGSFRRPSVEPLRIPTNTEISHMRAIVAEREAKISALETKVRDLRAIFETEKQEKVGALRSLIGHLHSQIVANRKDMDDNWPAFFTEHLEVETAEVTQEKVAALRNTADRLHSQIYAMAGCWSTFSTQLQEAKAAATAKINNLEVHIHIMKRENTNAASFLAPIRRLPVEILAEIFLLSIRCHAYSPLDLIRVCWRWRTVVLTTPRIWLNLRLHSWTTIDKIEFVLERTWVTPLDVEIDTSMDMFKLVDENKFRRYAGLERATMEAKRWRNLTITSFPTQLDIDTHSTPEKPVFTFGGPMDALQSFKIKSICENSTVFDQLLNVVGSSSHEKLSNIELLSPNAIYHLAQPQFASIFRRLVTFNVDVREMRTEVDILTHFERLETLEANHLHLPLYPIETDLPLVRTLKRMKIKNVSVQWMVGRTFPNMAECTIIWPHYPETLAPGGGVDLPLCTHFTYDDHIMDILPNFRLPKLDTLIVRCEAWNKPRGSKQLAAVWSGAAGQVSPLKPRVLHLDTQCHNQHLIDALEVLPQLEELYLGLVRPDGLGKTFFTALRTKKGSSSHSPSKIRTFKLCPNLRTFGIRYRRWIREGERDDITPILHKVAESRQKTDTPLKSFKFWPTKDTPEKQAVELCGHTVDAGRGGREPCPLRGCS